MIGCVLGFRSHTPNMLFAINRIRNPFSSTQRTMSDNIVNSYFFYSKLKSLPMTVTPSYNTRFLHILFIDIMYTIIYRCCQQFSVMYRWCVYVCEFTSMFLCLALTSYFEIVAAHMCLNIRCT